MSKKILFISNHASFFCSHRINLFKESLKKGYDFRLIFGNAASFKMEKEAIKILKKEKVKYTHINFSHNSLNLFNDFFALVKIIKFAKLYNPDIIHSASPKANFISSLLSKFYKTDKLILSISGLGYLFTDVKKRFLTRFKSFIYIKIVKFCTKNQNKKIIVQNNDDLKFMIDSLDLKKNEIILIEGGSGVESNFFKKFKKKKNKNIIMVSRIVANKGVKEFIFAAKKLKKKYPDWKFYLLGSKDYLSSDKIDESFLNRCESKRIVNIINYKSNILKYLRNSEIFCLPSYREGMPKTVLEALSIGLPVVTTNAVGCKDSIINGFNGLLCKKFDYVDLSKKLEILIKDSKLRKRMSMNAKKYAKKNFPIRNVTNKVYEIYNS